MPCLRCTLLVAVASSQGGVLAAFCCCAPTPATSHPPHAFLRPPCWQAAVARLFPLYMQPLREGRQVQAPSLYGRIKTEVQQCIQGLQLGACMQQQQQQHAAAQPSAALAGEGEAGGARTAAQRRSCSTGLAFELPYVSKFLLLAAYIASRNKPTADRAVFDPGFRRGGRRDAQAMDRQVGRGGVRGGVRGGGERFNG